MEFYTATLIQILHLKHLMQRVFKEFSILNKLGLRYKVACFIASLFCFKVK